MRNLTLLLLAASAACTPGSIANNVPPINLASPDARAAAESINAFGADLHGALPKDGNLFYSPTSIAIALAMAEQGARGETKDQMDKVLHLSPTSARAYAGLQARLATAKDPELAIANRMYFDGSLAIEPAFAKVAPNESVDYVHDAEGARGKINAWVSSGTHARIPELLPAKIIDKDTRFVLVNAIYFKGEWASAFDPHRTAPETFHGMADTQVPMMHNTLSAGLGQHGGADVLDMAYRSSDGPELSIVMVLPDASHSLSEVEAAYEKEGLAPFVSATTPSDEIAVTMPKLKMNADLQLGDPLQAMGMPAAFSDTADFTGITQTEQVKIAKVIHRAFVEIDEKGTEAAAATGVVGTKATAELGSAFRADHPFLFFVRDRASGVVLFAGRCVDPKS